MSPALAIAFLGREEPLRALLEREGLLPQVLAVLLECDVTLWDVVGEGRISAVARVRHWVTWILRDVLGLSYPVIGRYVHRDHTTVIMGVRRARRAQMAPLPVPWASVDEPPRASAEVETAIARERIRIAAYLSARARTTDGIARAELSACAAIVKRGEHTGPKKWPRG
jgi:hypothetical protein